MNNDTLRSTHISLYDFYQVVLVVYVNMYLKICWIHTFRYLNEETSVFEKVAKVATINRQNRQVAVFNSINVMELVQHNRFCMKN